MTRVNCKINNEYCGKCCYNTRMPLTQKDINRIEKLGYKKESFIVMEKGIIYLRNKGGKCVFLKNNKCIIYRHRPLGCKLYPLIYNGEKIVIDKICPKWKEVKPTQRDIRRLKQLIKQIYGIKCQNTL